MKVMIRKTPEGKMSAYVAKKDLEEPIVSMEKPEMWGGVITLGNGWQLELPAAFLSHSLGPFPQLRLPGAVPRAGFLARMSARKPPQ